jgi:hypothetical protein
VNLLGLLHRHQRASSAGEESEQSAGSPPGSRDCSLVSLPSQAPTPVQTEGERCLTWLIRNVRGRYPRLVDVRAAATAAGFSRAVVETALAHADVIIYRTFPRRNAPEVERVRTVDDWPDDPPLAAR